MIGSCRPTRAIFTAMLACVRVAVRGLDPNARYAVLKGAKGERVAELTGKELEDDGFAAVLPERCDGELYEITMR